MDDNTIPFKNPEGYADPTAYKAVTAVLREPDEADLRAHNLIRTLRGVVDLAGFDLLARFELHDRVSGRNYR